MKIVTYAEVQQLVVKLPKDKLPSAFRLLSALTTAKVQSSQAEFMRLSVDERTEWQAGDFIEG